jgi:hypothetical protein
MTPAEFLTRVFAAADELAFRLAGTPKELQATWIQDFARRVRRQWRPLFAPYLTAEDVDAVVADLVGSVEARLERISRFGSGTA